MRVGWGLDVHQFGGDAPVLFAGIPVDMERGLLGTSDADVVAHAVADALLGASALGDLGSFFPSSDPRWSGADSMELLGMVVDRFQAAGWRVNNLDVTIVAETVRVDPVREQIRSSLADSLHVDVGVVSVKATTTDGLGFLGSDAGVAAMAVVTATAGPH